MEKEPQKTTPEENFSFESSSKDEDYEILDVSPLENETGHEFRQRYIQLTAELIYRMQGYDTPESDKPDSVVFLDKSARPVEWLAREFWPYLCEPVSKDGRTQKPTTPKRKFLNIDREQWAHCFEEEKLDNQSSVYYFKPERVKEEEIRQLRQIFIPDYDPNEDVFEQRAILDSEKILVVDEVRLTGRTMVAAKNLLRLAFKNVEIDGHHWMMPEIIVDLSKGVRKNKESPKWYSENDPFMRGVGNRNPSENLFLSTRFEEADKKSQQLRDDIKQLVRDYEAGKYDVTTGKAIIEQRLRERERS